MLKMVVTLVDAAVVVIGIIAAWYHGDNCAAIEERRHAEKAFKVRALCISPAVKTCETCYRWRAMCLVCLTVQAIVIVGAVPVGFFVFSTFFNMTCSAKGSIADEVRACPPRVLCQQS